jgi:S-adenosylmethionine:tRNA ribosyltransferase-isomerase
MSLDLLTQSYNYILLPEYIASSPVQPRDHAKLLVYDRTTDTITHTLFKHLLDFVPKECDIFLNDTRVIKARIFGKKAEIGISREGIVQGGGAIELLFNKPLDAYRCLVMIKGKVKEGSKLYFEDTLVATVLSQNEDGSRIVSFQHHDKAIRFEALVLVLDKIGHLPLPPYMQRQDTQEDERDYQTLFAKNAGAVAAPTASLHFTPLLLEALKKRHQTHTLTLHVGAGTFKPVDKKEILSHPMHSEYFDIPDNSAQVLETNKTILAIGTTVTRTIEYYMREKKQKGECDLFLHPNNPPKRVTHLLTNFHLPKSTLIMLVSAFVGREKTLALYQEAIDKEYRFFSYGDAMLII